jgi:hypothetical protein
MMLDNALIFSDAQDLTETAVSTNVLDMGVARDLGTGEPMWLLFQFGTVVSNGTWIAILNGSAAVGMSGPVVKATTGAAIIPLSNTLLAMPINPGVAYRYYQISYTIASGTSPHIPTTAALVRDTELKFHSKTYR